MAGAGMRQAAVALRITGLRSSPAWNGRCWRSWPAADPSATPGCDPHRLGMAGAGWHARNSHCWTLRLRSSPAWNGRCWQSLADGAVHVTVVAILTGLEWPVLAHDCAVDMPAEGLRCDPHRLGMAGAGGK